MSLPGAVRSSSAPIPVRDCAAASGRRACGAGHPGPPRGVCPCREAGGSCWHGDVITALRGEPLTGPEAAPRFGISVTSRFKRDIPPEDFRYIPPGQAPVCAAGVLLVPCPGLPRRARAASTGPSRVGRGNAGAQRAAFSQVAAFGKDSRELACVGWLGGGVLVGLVPGTEPQDASVLSDHRGDRGPLVARQCLFMSALT